MGNENRKASSKFDLAIKEKLKKNEKVNRGVFKLLLLGAGESGKSTILKQILILHGNGIDPKLRKSYKSKIAYNIILGAQEVIKAMTHLNLEYEDQEAVESAKLVNSIPLSQDPSVDLDDKLVKSLLYLSYNAGFQAAINQSHKFQLEDSWPEFMSRLEDFPAWGGPDWLPSDDDILLSRVRTTGVVHQGFQVEKAKFEMIDVGGQRAERKKWITLFTGVSGVIFVSSLSEYNQTLFEELGVNRLAESVQLWHDNCNRPEFKNSALIFFLNKFDLFQEKYFVKKIPLINPLPKEYMDPPKVEDEADNKCLRAVAWFRGLFLSQVAEERKHDVYFHTTNALDKEQMRAVIDAASNHILQQSLMESGLVPKYPEEAENVY